MTEQKKIAETVRESNNEADYLGSQGLGIGDGLELVYKFIFDPRSDFPEINKSWSITDLKPEEVQRIVNLVKSIRILDKKGFYRPVKRKVPTGEYLETIDKTTGRVIKKEALYIEEEVYVSRFDPLIQKYKGEIQAITASAGGRQASVIRAFRTAAQQTYQSVKDETPTRGFGRR